MQTPTRKVKIGRKPASECSGDFCRLCKCAFKMKFGNIDDIKGRKIVLVCGEIIIQYRQLFACVSLPASQESIYKRDRLILCKGKTPRTSLIIFLISFS